MKKHFGLQLQVPLWGRDTALKCYRTARAAGYRIFGLRNGKCLVGRNAENYLPSFDKYNSGYCSRRGTGTSSRLDVYLVAGL